MLPYGQLSIDVFWIVGPLGRVGLAWTQDFATACSAASINSMLALIQYGAADQSFLENDLLAGLSSYQHRRLACASNPSISRSGTFNVLQHSPKVAARPCMVHRRQIGHALVAPQKRNFIIEFTFCCGR
jgi:hypothetical protein